MFNGFFNLLKKDLKMMLSGKFFLLAVLSLMLYSCYINFIYVNIEQENFNVYLYDPKNLNTQNSEYLKAVNSRTELENICADRSSIGVDFSENTPEIYMLSSGLDTMDNYRAAWAEAVLSGQTQGSSEIIGAYNKEQKSRREITAEFLFFEISAVGFLGLASMLFKEKSMGVIRVHGILPVSKAAFILSKLLLLLASDLVFTALLTFINVGVSEGISILPQVLIQAGILSLIMSPIGFFCAVWLPDFKQFSLVYLVLAIFITTPVFLVGQTGVEWKWIIFHPMYHLFSAIKSAYFGSTATSLPYYFICIAIIAALFFAAYKILSREMKKEG